MSVAARLAAAVLAAAACCAPALAAEDVIVEIPLREAHIHIAAGPEPQQAILAVFDPQGEPIRGLQARDLFLARGLRTGKVLAVETLPAREIPPLNLICVVDNSFSIQERGAAGALLSALELLLHDLRPIDRVHAVVFAHEERKAPGGRTLHVRTLNARTPAEWKRGFTEALDRGSTSRTFLYEAMLAAVEIARSLPAGEPKFLAVFSDGEDLHSRIRPAEVEAAAQGIPRLHAYAIDFRPVEAADPFLTAFARNQRGRVWKARAAADLGPIFQTLRNTITHRYRVAYELANPVALEPRLLQLEVPATLSGDPALGMLFFPTGRGTLPEPYIQLKGREETEAFRSAALTGFSSRYFNLLNWVGKGLREVPEAKLLLTGCTSSWGPEADNLKLAQQRAEAVRDYLQRIWGIERGRILLEARGLPSRPSAEDDPERRRENQRVEMAIDPPAAATRILGAAIAESRGQSVLRVALELNPRLAIGEGEIEIRSADQVLHRIRLGPETGARASFPVPLDELGRGRLLEAASLEAFLRLRDRQGRLYEASSDLCHIQTRPRPVVRELSPPPYGTVTLEPATLRLEEVTAIESAPLLPYVYFETASTEIPERYVRFASAAEAASFEPSALRGTLAKYRHLLNVIGKRAAERPGSRLRIVGCRSENGEERGRAEISRGRAAAVRDYLRAVWGIDPGRMTVEARGLPEFPSASLSPEGRAENRRVEIYADDPAILDPVTSTHLEIRSDVNVLRIAPLIEPGARLRKWALVVYGDDRRLDALEGEGDLEPAYVLPLAELGLGDIGRLQAITVQLEAVDGRGQVLRARDSAAVEVIRREERGAQRQGHRVEERWALILFDFDRAEIRDRHRRVIERIAARVREVPGANVRVVGHTDAIGAPARNVELSRKRAEAAARLLASALPDPARLRVEGRGPQDAPFDNALPEGRAYNRTVTVTLEYEERP